VAGTVQVSFRKKRKIESISIKLHGFEKADLVQYLDQEEKHHDRVFLQLSTHIWPPPNTTSDTVLQPGTHSWPFSFTLPRETVNLGRSGATYPLPPSFTTEYFPDHLVYELVACARRGSFFREDEFLIVPVRYVPRPVAGTPSPARALSYARGSALLGPDADPDGWMTKSVEFCGKYFGKNDVRVSCDLSLASPLDYPRGFPIPFVITLRSADPQALAAFASPTGLTVALNRQVVRFKRAKDSETSKSKEVARGQYWSVYDSSEMKTLQGELHVPLSVGPGFSYKTLSLLYRISLTASTIGFDMKEPGPALTMPVTIAYFPPEDVKPRSFAPPAPYSEETAAPSRVAPKANLVSVA